MTATIKEAEENWKNLIIRRTGYGQYLISMNYRGKYISCHTTNSIDVDNFNAEYGEILDLRNRVKTGYENLCNEIINRNKS